MSKKIPERSLWTAIRTGSQRIITSVHDDGEWVDYIDVGRMGTGGCRVDHLLETHVMASESCTVEARAH